MYNLKCGCKWPYRSDGNGSAAHHGLGYQVSKVRTLIMPFRIAYIYRTCQGESRPAIRTEGGRGTALTIFNLGEKVFEGSTPHPGRFTLKKRDVTRCRGG